MASSSENQLQQDIIVISDDSDHEFDMDLDSSQQIGSSNKRKRKSPGSFSTNVHTVKARKRLEAIKSNSIQNQIEKAKAADQAAVTYRKKVLKKSAEFALASFAEQKRMIEQSALQVKTKRERDGKDWKSVAKALGYGEIGGLYAIDDDGNPAWEDIEYDSEDEYEFEHMWRLDEKQNGDKAVVGKTAKELKNDGIAKHKRSILDAKKLEFKFWQRKWRRSRRSLFRKIRKLSAGGQEYLERTSCPYIYKNKFYAYKTPTRYFTQGEKAVWKNLAAWAYGNEEWIDLPGPANWWPADDKLNETGFGFSDSLTGHKEAFDMVYATEIPEDGSYERIFPAYNDLFLMTDNSLSQTIVKAFFGLQSSFQKPRKL